ncbi:MAG: hypothetical protein RLZ98_2554 [Pseudomonadota bacterium]|jgi:tRNA 2-thiouridine synthesizing protein A
MADKFLDTRGLKCPLPVLKARKALKAMPPQSQLEVLATDPGSVSDFQELCNAAGHQLLETGEDDGVFRFLICKTA